MEINPVGQIAASIQDMSQMLTQMTDAKLAFDDKVLRTVGAEQEQAAQTNAAIDTYA